MDAPCDCEVHRLIAAIEAAQAWTAEHGWIPDDDDR
jgi:hypothetical protein